MTGAAGSLAIELRVITAGKYWTVYQGKKYLGAVARKGDVFRAVHDGLVVGEASCLEFAVEMFREYQ